MAPGHGPRLRLLVGKFQLDFAPVAGAHPEIAAALAELESSVVEAFPLAPLRPRRKPGRPPAVPHMAIQRLKNQLKWSRRARRMLAAQFAKLKAVKNASQNSRITPGFITKVALSHPSTCARAFANAWKELIGVGAQGCARTTIGRIRDAFAECCKELCCSQVRSAVAGSRQTAIASADRPEQALLCATALHIHDEASLRLRSASDALPGMPSRSRSSKVQQHCVSLHSRSQAPVRWLVELDPLADKTAGTLATSLERVVRPLGRIVGEVFASGGAMRQRSWFVHFLVGDGAPTNEAAAKLLFSWMRRNPLANDLKYFLVVVKCANHQANLCVATVVAGRTGLVGAASSAPIGASLAAFGGRSVCGAITRLFKYLISDYEAEFASNLQDLTSRLCARRHSPELGAERQRWQGLRDLYDEGVLPGEILDILNGGLPDWVHVTENPAAIAPDRMVELRDNLLRLLRKRILVVDEQPTMTRMFTFTKHMECLLLLHFLGCTRDMVKMRGTEPRTRSRKRVEKVLTFMFAEDTDQYLRRSCLALQLVAHVNALCAQLHDCPTPVLVRLSQGAAQRVVAEDFGRLVPLLHLDATLDFGAAFTLLLGTAVEVVVRFGQYLAWPCAAWRLCQKFNPDGYVVACINFLGMPEEELDVGFGSPLRRLAQLAGELEGEHLRYLLSAPVQAALQDILEASAASSLPVERAFAETKRSEAPRLCHVATAGRNQLIKQFLRHRDALLAEATSAAALLRQANFANLQSLAWEIKPDLVGNGREMRTFIAQREPELRRELERRKAAAKAAVARVQTELPVTEAQWAEWFTAHEDEFQERMKSATAARKLLNKRLPAAPDLPAPCARLNLAARRPKMRKLPLWIQLAWRRSGGFCVQLLPSGVATFFLYEFHGRSYIVDISHLRRGKFFRMDCNGVKALVASVKPLEEAGWEHHQVKSLYQVSVSAKAAPQGIDLGLGRARPVTAPVKLRRRRKRKASASTAELGSSDSASSAPESAASAPDSELEALGHIEADVRGSSGDSSCPSVDTEADSGLDDFMAEATNALVSDEDAAVSDMEEPDAPTDDREWHPGVPGEEGGPRHALGTWTVWSNMWVYITRNEKYSDVKCCVKAPLRNAETGLGRRWLSKAITPAHYGEVAANPVRSILLLRSWMVWRVQQDGWAAARDCRRRELDRQPARLEADLQGALGHHPSAPFFGCAPAHQLFARWVPDMVDRLLHRRMRH